jgi:hypothetical protein
MWTPTWTAISVRVLFPTRLPEEESQHCEAFEETVAKSIAFLFRKDGVLPDFGLLNGDNVGRFQTENTALPPPLPGPKPVQESSMSVVAASTD